MRNCIALTLSSLSVALLPGVALAEDGPAHRVNRVSLSLGYGIGSASLSDYHEGVDGIVAQNQAANPGATFDGDLKSSFQMSGEMSVRYYAKHHLVAHLGFAGLYNNASTNVSQTGFQPLELSAHNIVLENSLLGGGYYPVHDRITVYGLAGLSLGLKGWSIFDPGSDFQAGFAPGARVLVGGDFFLGDSFAIGVELGYRHLKTSDLAFDKDSNVKFPNNPGGDEVDLDVSGITAQINMRLFAF